MNGRQLGPYRVEEKLGQGGMGVVYAAYDQRLDRRVAVKRVPADADQPKRRARLRREARLTARLAHAAVVRIFDLVEEEDADWIVMELVEGRTLRAVLKEGPLGVDQALAFGRQIAEGLAAAHEQGIVHRDLKTENVMVLANGEVKILDFGLAKRHDSFTESGGDDGESVLSMPGQVLGTGRAMSPEQARGLEVGPRSDLFSLGVLLYEALTAVSPFRGASFSETIVRVATLEPPPLEDLVNIPPALADLVQRLLRKPPELRPANAREVAERLSAIADERRLADLQSSSQVTEEETLEGPSVTEAVFHEEVLEPSFPSQQNRRPWFMGVMVTVAALVVLVILMNNDGSGPAAEAPALQSPSLAAENVGEESITDSLAHYEEGMRLVRRIYHSENIERAQEIFQQLLAQNPDSAAAYAGLARAHWERWRNASMSGDPIFLEQARAAAEESLRLDPFLADAHVSLGLILLSQDENDDARQHIVQAQELDPINPDAWYTLARIETRDKEWELAESHLRRAIEIKPTTLYYDALGSLLYRVARLDDSAAAFEKSIGIAPDNSHALRNLGGIYYVQGRADEAAVLLQDSLKIEPHASAYANLGNILFSKGLYHRAATVFENALQTGGATHDYRFWINLADAYRQIPKEEDAAKTYKRALELLAGEIEGRPDDTAHLSRRNLVWAKVGQCESALESIDKLRDQDGMSVYSKLRQTIAEEICGERDRALESLGEALRGGLDLTEVQQKPDLLDLRADIRFHQLISELSETP